MKRRDLLKAGAAAGICGALPGTSGCAPQRGVFRHHDLMPPPNMAEFLPRFDRALAHLARPEVASRLIPTPALAKLGADAPEVDRMGRSLRALYVTGVFHDLPLESQLHPGMQERMRAFAPEMERTVNEVTEMFANLPADKRKQMKTVLTSQPELPLQMAAEIETLAKDAGIREHRLHQVREGMQLNGWRLRKQPPSLIIDEYTDKVNRVAPRTMSQRVLQRKIASLVGNSVMLRARMAAMSQSRQAQQPVPQQPVPQQPAPYGPPGTNPGQPAVYPAYMPPPEPQPYFGLKIMGLGGIVFAGGLVVIGLGAALEAEQVVEAGAYMTIIGLPIILLGLLVWAVEAIARS